MIPEGWKNVMLGDLCSIAIGGTPSRSMSEYWDTEKTTDNLWVSVRDMDQTVIRDTKEYITDLGIEKSNVKSIDQGRLLMSFKLTIGKLSIAGRRLYTNEAICALIPRNNAAVSEFLLYALRSWDLFQNADAAIKGTTLNKEKIANIAGLLPPLAEQKKIAAILSSVDRCIEKTGAMVAKLQDLKKAMMQELLTKGLPPAVAARHGIKKSGKFKNSPLGPVPEEWEVVRLRSICSAINNGFVGTATPYYTDDSGVLYIMGNNVRPNTIDLTKRVYVQASFLEKQAKAVVDADNLLTVQSGHIGTTCVVPQELEGAGVHAVIISRLYLHKGDPQFLSRYINMLNENRSLSRIYVGSTIQHINTSDLAKLEIVLPSLGEQKAISSILMGIDGKERVAARKRDHLQSLKKALMQDLLTGRVRVKVDNAA